MGTRLFVFLALTSVSFSGMLGCSSGKVQPVTPVEQSVSDSEVELVVKSTPNAASVSFSSGEKCTTPCKLQKSTSESFTVTVSKRDYKPATVKVNSNLNLLREYNRRAGASQAVIDSLKVDELRLSPNPVEVVLEPEWSR